MAQTDILLRSAPVMSEPSDPESQSSVDVKPPEDQNDSPTRPVYRDLSLAQLTEECQQLMQIQQAKLIELRHTRVPVDNIARSRLHDSLLQDFASNMSTMASKVASARQQVSDSLSSFRQSTEKIEQESKLQAESFFSHATERWQQVECGSKTRTDTIATEAMQQVERDLSTLKNTIVTETTAATQRMERDLKTRSEGFYSETRLMIQQMKDDIVSNTTDSMSSVDGQLQQLTLKVNHLESKMPTQLSFRDSTANRRANLARDNFGDSDEHILLDDGRKLQFVHGDSILEIHTAGRENCELVKRFIVSHPYAGQPPHPTECFTQLALGKGTSSFPPRDAQHRYAWIACQMNHSVCLRLVGDTFTTVTRRSNLRAWL